MDQTTAKTEELSVRISTGDQFWGELIPDLEPRIDLGPLLKLRTVLIGLFYVLGNKTQVLILYI